jgi:putative chitinase
VFDTNTKPASPARSYHLTPEKLTKVEPNLSLEKAKEMTPHMNAAFDEFKIDTPRKVSAFLANSGVETQSFTKFRETASGKRYEPETNPGKLVGNTQKGDGPLYKGAGGLMLTGRENFTRASQDLGLGDRLVKNPEAAECPNLAWRTAGWHWSKKGNNEQAEKGNFGETVRRTQGQANGPYTHRDRRDAYYQRAMEAFGEPLPAAPPPKVKRARRR